MVDTEIGLDPASLDTADLSPVVPDTTARPLMRWTVAATTIGAFGLVAARAFTPVYIEGDDAVTVAYHALGRDEAFQDPYAPYHAGGDLMLSLLGTDEATVRWGAMLLGLVAAAAFVVGVLQLIHDWADEGIPMLEPVLHGPHRRLLGAGLALVLLLAAPELLYLGLAYLPSVVGMALITWAHVVARRAIDTPRPIRGLATAALLMGLGTATRWDLLLYGLVVAADLVFVLPRPSSPGSERRSLASWLTSPRVARTVTWGVASLLVWLVLVLLAGHSPADLLSGLDTGTSYPRSYALVAATWSSFFTPFLVVAVAMGVAHLPRARRTWVVAQLVYLVLAVVALRISVPKVLVVTMPAILLTASIGTSRIFLGRRPATRFAAALLLLLPWIVGVQYERDDAAWGPGFELQAIDRPAGSNSTSVSAVFGGGGAIGTPEGPRPVWGHGSVLLGGGWRTLMSERADAREAAIDHATATGRLYVIAQGASGYALSYLSGAGFDQTAPTTVTDVLRHRTFTSDAASVVVVRVRGPEALIGDDASVASALRQLNGGSSIVVVSGYPSTLRELHLHNPAAVRPLGPEAAEVDLDELRG
ncbi:MAG: hypothetical protein AAF480_11075 [Actinomycetota bacterium]